MNRSTWLIARAIWAAFAIVFLVFSGLELVFRVLDEAKLPHTNYTADEVALVSIFGMPRRLYLDLPLMGIDRCCGGAWWSGAIESAHYLTCGWSQH